MCSVIVMILLTSVTETQMKSDPAALTRQIKKERKIQALLHTYCQYASLLNDIHLSACWTSLGRLAEQPAERFWQQRNSGALKLLLQHTEQAVKAGELGGREFANVAYGAARGVRDAPLFAAFATAAQQLMGNLKAQELANVAWAFAATGQKDASLFAAFATAAKRCMSNFKAQELANLAWAFATAGQKDASLFAALATAAKQCVGDFKAQELANTAWAFATAGHEDVSLFAALATSAEQCMSDFKA